MMGQILSTAGKAGIRSELRRNPPPEGSCRVSPFLRSRYGDFAPTENVDTINFQTAVDPFGTNRPEPLKRRALQLQSAKQLRVRSYDDGGETHRDCANAHGKIESPADEKTRCDRNGDKVIGGCPNQILDHLSVGSTR